MDLCLNNCGTTIKMVREAKNVRQYVLQDALKNACNLSKLEANKTQLSLVIFHEILELLDVSIDEFFLLHSLQDSTSTFFYDAAYESLNLNASRAHPHFINETRKSLAMYSEESLHNVKTIKSKLLYHKLSCFYYLNFQKNVKKAKSHSVILLEYYKNTINMPLLSELSLLPMILPFVSLQEGKSLLTDFSFFNKWQKEKHYSVQNVYLHAELTFAKRCLQERSYALLQETLGIIDYIVRHFPSIDVYAEWLILKGISLYDAGADKSEGKSLIEQGLKLAKDFQLTNIYNAWKKYCQYIYK